MFKQSRHWTTFITCVSAPSLTSSHVHRPHSAGYCVPRRSASVISQQDCGPERLWFVRDWWMDCWDVLSPPYIIVRGLNWWGSGAGSRWSLWSTLIQKKKVPWNLVFKSTGVDTLKYRFTMLYRECGSFCSLCETRITLGLQEKNPQYIVTPVVS